MFGIINSRGNSSGTMFTFVQPALCQTLVHRSHSFVHTWASWHLKSLAIQLFVEPFVLADIEENIKACYSPFVRRIHWSCTMNVMAQWHKVSGHQQHWFDPIILEYAGFNTRRVKCNVPRQSTVKSLIWKSTLISNKIVGAAPTTSSFSI